MLTIWPASPSENWPYVPIRLVDVLVLKTAGTIPGGEPGSATGPKKLAFVEVKKLDVTLPANSWYTLAVKNGCSDRLPD